ncbi:MAG: hypothetical protein ACE5OY_03220 [Candidatus Bathyarchaeia archaeon]
MGGVLALLGGLGALFVPGALALGLAGLSIIVGAFNLVLAWGLWIGASWAWLLALIFAGLGILQGLFNFPAGLLTVLINAVIIYYLTRPHVKGFFGR